VDRFRRGEIMNKMGKQLSAQDGGLKVIAFGSGIMGVVNKMMNKKLF